MDRTLIIAPHPDDEFIGCLPVLYAPSKVHVILVTTGDRFERISEFINSAKYFEFTFTVLNEKDGSGKISKQSETYIKAVIPDYDHVYIPWCKDEHIDHKNLGYLLQECRPKKGLYAYSNITKIPNTEVRVSVESYWSERLFEAVMQQIYPTEYIRLLKDNYPNLYRKNYEYIILYTH